jgi:hypothetical protein
MTQTYDICSNDANIRHIFSKKSSITAAKYLRIIPLQNGFHNFGNIIGYPIGVNM